MHTSDTPSQVRGSGKYLARQHMPVSKWPRRPSVEFTQCYAHTGMAVRPSGMNTTVISTGFLASDDKSTSGAMLSFKKKIYQTEIYSIKLFVSSLITFLCVKQSKGCSLFNKATVSADSV